MKQDLPDAPPHTAPGALIQLLLQLVRIDALLQEKLQRVLATAQAHGDAPTLAMMADMRLHMGERYWRARIPDWQAWRDARANLPPDRLDLLAARFRLNAFETDLLLLCVLPVLDSRYWLLLACLQGDGPKAALSRELALAVLCTDFLAQVREHTSFAPEAPLFRHRLLHWQPQSAIAGDAALHVDMAVYQYLLGGDRLPARLAGLARWLAPMPPPDPHAAMTARLIALFDAAPDQAIAWLVLKGQAGSGRAATVARAGAALGWRALEIDLRLLPEDDAQAADLLSLGLRAAALHGACALLRGMAELALRSAQLLAQLKENAAAASLNVIILAEPHGAPLPLEDMAHVAWDMPASAPVEQVAMLRRELRNARLEQAVDLPALVKRYHLTDASVPVLVREARGYCRMRGGVALSQADLRRACSARSQQGFGELARRSVPARSLDDLIISAQAAAQVREILAAIRQRERVLAQGFAGKLGQATGISALFHGDSGTGKTLAAEALAHALGVDLITIDLSTVVNKYIGETEKNLSRVFDLAEKDSGVLLFDEADALFGKRSASKDAKDRHANIEVSYLLQRLEKYPGLVILSTNNRSHLDEAFNRRITFMVRFGFPDVTLRERLWRAAWPEGLALSPTIDFSGLARQAELTGANIRNIALFAAWQAAERGGVIDSDLIELGMQRELSKMGRA